MVALSGDYFGHSVNLLARIVNVARPNTVVVADELRNMWADDRRFVWQRLPAKRLKGLRLLPCGRRQPARSLRRVAAAVR
jgi:class 3 adenylate cyclase